MLGLIQGGRKPETPDARPAETSTSGTSGTERTFGIETALTTTQWD